MANSSKFNGLVGMIIIMTLFCESAATATIGRSGRQTSYRNNNNKNYDLFSPPDRRTIPYGKSCGDFIQNQACIEGLHCVNGRCGCKEYWQYFEKKQRCLSHGPCDGVGQCVPHASCHRNECKCDPGFVQNLEMACVLGYMEKCPLEDVWCEDKFSCINGRCRCKTNFQVYNLDKKKCVSLAGEPCEVNDDCADGTICAPQWNEANISSEGICIFRQVEFPINTVNRTSNKESRLKSFDLSTMFFIGIVVLLFTCRAY